MVNFSKKSIDFDGSNDYVNIGDVAPFKFDVGDAFSISAWVKTTDASALIVSKLDAASPNTGWEVGITTGGVIFFQFFDDSTVPQKVRVDSTLPVNNNAWQHIVVTKNTTELASGVTIYRNGIVDSSIIDDTFVSNGGTSFDGTTPLQIGVRDTTAAPFDGLIDDVAIYDKELTVAEIAAIRGTSPERPSDLRLVGPTCNLVGYWTMGDGDTFPTLRDRQNSIATTVAGGVLDRSSNSNDGTPTNMEDGDFRDVIFESELMPDLSSNNNPGIPSNMLDTDFKTDTPGGASCYSTELDGVDGYILIGDVPEFQFAQTDDFSVTGWFKTTSNASFSSFFSKRDVSGSGTGFEFGFETNFGLLTPIILMIDSSSNNMTQESSGDYNDDTWYHVAYVWNGSAGLGSSSATIYVDGVDVSSTGAGTLVTTIDNSADAQIGATDGISSAFDGYIDDVAVFNTALTSTEVQEIYNSGIPVDIRSLTVQPDLVGYWGMGEISAGGISRYVSDLDGSDESVVIGNISALNFERTDPFSLEIWFRQTSPAQCALISKFNSIADGWFWEINSNSGGELTFNLWVTAGDRLTVRTNINGLGDDNWHHAVVSYDGSQTAAGTFFVIDGVQDNGTAIAETLATNIANTRNVVIGGRDAEAGFYFNGQLSGAAIYDRALTLTEAQALYNNGIPADATLFPTESNLVGYWFMGPNANDGTMTNMVAGDIVEEGANEAHEKIILDVDVLPMLGADGYSTENQSDFPTDWSENPSTQFVGGEGFDIPGGGFPGTTFHMRGIDLAGPFPSYHTWEVLDSPDTDGSEAGTLPFGGPLTEIIVVGISS